MFALIRDLSGALGWADNPLLWLVVVAFQLWMLIDAVRRGEWIWVACIVFFSVLSAVFYYFMVYRQQGPAGGGVGLRGFELPGAADRRRIKELLGRIHHLDKARDSFLIELKQERDQRHAHSEKINASLHQLDTSLRDIHNTIRGGIK